MDTSKQHSTVQDMNLLGIYSDNNFHSHIDYTRTSWQIISLFHPPLRLQI